MVEAIPGIPAKFAGKQYSREDGVAITAVSKDQHHY
jgi:hypothetical protein